MGKNVLPTDLVNKDYVGGEDENECQKQSMVESLTWSVRSHDHCFLIFHVNDNYFIL